MKLVDLEGFEDRKPPQMSGGQQQRVALARALVNHPKVLLLDEPLGALDLKLRKQMQLELKRIQQEVGITFIYVTHDQEEAMTMSNRLAVMRHGKIEQLGAPEEVYENPATEFVAGFLGASNLLEGELKEQQRRRAPCCWRTGTTVLVPVDRIPADAATRVKVGVRPEKISIAPRGRPAPVEAEQRDRGASHVDVHRREPPVQGRGPGRQQLTVYVQNLGADAAPQPGERVVLSWHPENTFVVSPPGRPLDGGGGRMTEQQRPREREISPRSAGHDAAPDVAARPAQVRGRGVGALSMAAVLAACGGDERHGRRRPARSAVAPRSTSAGSIGGHVNFANWPLYIDISRKEADGTVIYPSLEGFTEDNGRRRQLRRQGDPGQPRVLRELQPQLQAGQDTGWDIIVITNGRELTAMQANDWVVELDPSQAAELRRERGRLRAKDPAYDPGNKFTMAWQSGITGDRRQHRAGPPAEITSMDDLADPAKVGTNSVGMLKADMPDFVMINLGIDPETSRSGGVAGGRRLADDAAGFRHGPAVLRPGLLRRPHGGEPARDHGLVGRRPVLQRSGAASRSCSCRPDDGGAALDRQHDDPRRAPRTRMPPCSSWTTSTSRRSRS